MLLREVDQCIGLTARVAECFVDYRPNSVEHQVVELLIQRIYAIALGYEDLNDHDALRGDLVFSVLAGKQDLLGKARVRQRDRNHALGSASTLNRFELGESQEELLLEDLRAFNQRLLGYATPAEYATRAA